MKNDLYRILMLEDDDMDAQLIQMYLKKSNLKVEPTLVSNKQDYIKALESDDFDVILSDHNLPQFSSLEALQIRNQKKFHIPFILVSGKIPEEYAVTLLQEGANDYILKDRPQRLPSAIMEAIKRQKIAADKIKAEEELIKTNERLKLVGKATADAVWDWDLKTNEMIWGEGYEILFGYDLSKLAANIESWINHIHPKDKERVLNGIFDVINDSNKSSWEDEYKYIKADGSYAMVLDKGIVLRNEKGAAYRMVGAMQDITHVRQLENQLLQEKLLRQEEITKTTLKAQEKERSEIGKELHDNVNQLLASAKMMIEAALRSSEMHDVCIKKSIEALTVAIAEVRNISHNMMTPVFEEREFSHTMKEMVENINLAGKLKVKLKATRGLMNVNDELKLTIYRIIQEQMNNILKHADATEAELTFRETSTALEITISDNGKGFDPSIRRKGIGLSNIKNRAEMLNGKVEVLSSPGNGCTVKIVFDKTLSKLEEADLKQLHISHHVPN